MDIVVAENDFEFTYTKIADLKNGEFILLEPYVDSGVDLNHMNDNAELKNTIEKILACKVDDKLKVQTKNQIAKIENLEEGVYLIEGTTNQKYTIAPVLITIPSGGEGELSYHVSIFPKIQENVEKVETGDTTQITFLIILCIISLLIVLCLSCVFFTTVLQ